MTQKTALHALHLELGAKMGPFAGYDMPLYYGEGVIKEHEWVRSSCGLFDVSHMGQAMIKGKEGGRDALDFIQKLTPASFEKLGINRTKYTVLTNPEGGIIDDLMVTRTAENGFHLVINAGCKDKDLAWIKQNLPEDIELQYHDDWALLAVQGPKSETVMKEALGLDLADLPYMGLWYKDFTMFISRLGYTGEDGFEIAIKNDEAEALAKKLLANPAVKPIGLAARDSLRLEMGYALYGHEINMETSPVEAALEWVMGKNASGYFGEARIKKELANGAAKRLVGIKILDKGVAREGAEIQNDKGEVIGVLTSGGYSPSLKESIGIGYVTTALAKAGQRVFVNVRGRNLAAEVATMPFIPAKTKAAKKKEAA
jgi:aminomethyltransferase